MRTLVLYAAYTDQLSYYDDWLDAFKQHPSYTTTVINVAQQQADITGYELIILHHSMTADTLKYLVPYTQNLKDRQGKLLAFVGNEVNIPAVSMRAKINLLKDLETDIVATQLLLEAGQWLYNDCSKSKIISVPHALNPQAFNCHVPMSQRIIDLGTRSTRYGVYIGDNQRNEIIEYFHKNAANYGLKVDVGLEKKSQQRYNRQQWCDFLNTCKATLATEAGSFYLDKDDQIIKQIVAYAQQQQTQIILPTDGVVINLIKKILSPSIKNKLRSLLKQVVITQDQIGENFDFWSVKDQFFTTDNKCPVYSKAISSRHFDAIGTKTLQVMYPGRYNDILIAGQHYFALQPDHSNIDQLLDLLKNTAAIEKITTNVHEYVLREHTHAKRLDAILSYL